MRCRVGILLLSVFLWLGSSLPAHACTWAWDPPTTNTDGSPVSGLTVYLLYWLAPDVAEAVEKAAIAAPATTWTEPGRCAKGAYWMTVTNSWGNESAPSNIVTITSPGKSKLRFRFLRDR